MRHRGTLLALLVVSVVLGVQARRFPGPRYDRFDLPAFDAHVYVAMAEHPSFFTVAPWGYRVLTPALVHALPVRTVVRGFRYVTLGGLALAGVLLFVYLRRLGHGEAASLVGVLAFALSGPVTESLRFRFLVEPLTLVLEVALLLALDAGLGVGMLALLVTLGTLSKEFFLLLVPLLYLQRRFRDGHRHALAAAGVAGLCGLGAALLLRLWWTPYVQVPWPRPGPGLLALGFERARESWHEWWALALLAGLTPLAVLGLFREASRPLRVPAAYLFLICLVSPLLNPVTFFPRDIPRLMLYALPAVLPLALLAVDRVWPHVTTAAPPVRSRPALEIGAGLAVAVVCVVLAARLDRYRRADLQGPRDGPLVLALSRETLRTASRLERGQTVAFDLAAEGFVWGESDPAGLGQMRWFLRDGWGPRPHYGGGAALMEQTRATLLIPAFGGSDLDVALRLEAATATSLEVSLNGRSVGSILIEPPGREARLRLPAGVLLRGDNLLALSRAAPGPGPRLLALTIRPVVDPPGRRP